MMTAIMASKAMTNPAVMAESVQLLLTILITAHTAMIGDLIIICRPIATSIWIWVAVAVDVRTVQCAARDGRGF